MKIYIQDNNHIDVTIKSLTRNCPAVSYSVFDTDSLDLGCVDDDYVFALYGSSFKVFTKHFERIVTSTLPYLRESMSSRMYPGVYINNSFKRAYKWKNVADPEMYDPDVSLIDVNAFKNSDPAKRVVDLLPINLNCKDDDILLSVAEPITMLEYNSWSVKHAGLLNFSENLALGDNDCASILSPYDILYQYTSNQKKYKPIKHKCTIFKNNFNKLRNVVQTDECFK